jgi:glycosyltransferase involved in cell wall biosynthesis
MSPHLSLVIPVFNEEAVLPILRMRLEALHEVLKSELGVTMEWLFVNDGSSDQTLEILKGWAKDDPRVKIASFSRNFGQQMAVTAGVDLATGDAIVILDSDLQDPPELIMRMIEKHREGFDVVYAQRRSRAGETLFKVLTSRVYYWLMRQLIYKDLPERVSDFRLMSRPVADVMRQFSEHNRFYRGLVTWAGFRQTAVQFDRPARAGGETKWSPLKLLKLALDSVYSFSPFPLTLAYWIGGSALVTTVLLTVGSFAEPFGVATVSGFKTIIALNGLILVCLGMLGEYVFRTYEESKRRPLYIVNVTVNLEVEPGRLPSGGLIVSPLPDHAPGSRGRKAA